MGVILAYALMLGFKDPLIKPEDPRWEQPGAWIDNKFIEDAEFVFTILFSIDMFGGMITLGLRRFFKDSWNIMDTFVVGSGWLDLMGLKTGVGMLRMVRVFRPLRSLTKVESMRLVVQALISSTPGLANVLLLAAFMVFIFALFGLKLWIGVLSGRCFEETAEVTSALFRGHKAPSSALGELAFSSTVAWPGSHHYCCADVDKCGIETCSVGGERCVEYGNPEHGNREHTAQGDTPLQLDSQECL